MATHTATPSPVELLQNLLRFDTTNPPGNELACITYIKSLLDDAGIGSQLIAKDPNRPNLIARIPGGSGPALLLQGHVDVVTTLNQRWTHPPFSGDLIDGYVWGRGALDMKGAVAMMVSATLRAVAEGIQLPGDLVLACLSDEEHSSFYGARFLMEQHPDLFSGVRYSIGELGGFPLHIGGVKFYPIQIAEKQTCWLHATFRGAAGHAAMPLRNGAMAKLARFLGALNDKRLPVHYTPLARQTIEVMAANLPAPLSGAVAALLDPATVDAALDSIGPLERILGPMLRNTASPTVLRGGEQVNVIPSQIDLEIDARLLPGITPDDFLVELRELAGDEAELEVRNYDQYPGEVDMTLYETLATIMREADPEGVPMPYMQPAVTDARFFRQIGIQNYGFTPLNLPTGFDFVATIHAPDERVPATAVEFGAAAIFELLRRGW